MGKNNCAGTIVREPQLGDQLPADPSTSDGAGNTSIELHPTSGFPVRPGPEGQSLHPRDDERIICSGQWPSRLHQAYLVGLPTTRGLWNRAAEAMPTEMDSLEQEQLSWAALQSTLLHPLALHFPRDVNHDLATLEWLTNTFKTKGWASDAFVLPTRLCKNRLEAGDLPELVYKSYILDASSLENYFKSWDNDAVDPGVVLLGNNSLDTERNDLLEQYERGLYCNLRGPKESTIRSILSPPSKCVPNKSITANCSSPPNVSCGDPRDGLPKASVIDGGHVTLLEAVDGIARGTTGLTSWGGGAVMSEWLDNNKQLVEGRRVLELGSGVGYLASAMLESCCLPSAPPLTERQLQINITRGDKTTCGNSLNIGAQYSPVWRSSHCDTGDAYAAKESCASSPKGPASYTATDCHPHVLDLLFHNLSLMDPLKKWSPSDLRTHQQLMCESLVREELAAGDAPSTPWTPSSDLPLIRGVQTKVMHLDWRTPDLSSIPYADVIIAADIVYAKHLLRPLAVLLRRLLSRRSEMYPTPKTKGNDVKEERAAAPDETVSTAYIACTRRNNKTLSDFFSYLLAENLSYSLVYQATLDTESALFVYNESHIPVKVYKIVLSSV